MTNKQKSTLKHKISYIVIIVSVIFTMFLLLLNSWQNNIKSQKLDQSMSRKVSLENEKIPGPKGNKRPKNVPETSGKSFAASTSVKESELENDASRNASPVYLMQEDGVWIFRNFDTGKDHILTKEEIQKYVTNP